MKLPGGHSAKVPYEKVADYLLAPEHPEGGGKARFFLDRGYDRGRPDELVRAFLEMATTGRVTETIRTRHGTKHVVDGVVQTPDGRTAHLRTIWLTPPGERRPRLVTAYPR